MQHNSLVLLHTPSLDTEPCYYDVISINYLLKYYNTTI
jgi:hypothetical protein